MNKLSISKIDDAMKSIDTYSVMSKDWFGHELKIKKCLRYAEMKSFVDNVVSACITSDGDYTPENKDPAIRECVLTMYCNITLPNDISHKYDILYGSGLFETILGDINNDQFRQIVKAIDKKIDDAEEKNVQHVYAELNQVVNSMKSLTEEFGNLFKGITSDDIKNIIGAISNSKLDEEKLVKAYMEHSTK